MPLPTPISFFSSFFLEQMFTLCRCGFLLNGNPLDQQFLQLNVTKMPPSPDLSDSSFHSFFSFCNPHTAAGGLHSGNLLSFEQLIWQGSTKIRHCDLRDEIIILRRVSLRLFSSACNFWIVVKFEVEGGKHSDLHNLLQAQLLPPVFNLRLCRR